MIDTPVDIGLELLPGMKVVSGLSLSGYLSTQPGGEALDRFLENNRRVGKFLVVGSVAEMAKGTASPEELERLQAWWEKHESEYPYRKSAVNDLDMFCVIDGDAPNWVQTPKVEVKERPMKDGRVMVVVGEKVPELGDHWSRRLYFENEKIWAEIVPLRINDGVIEKQLMEQGYSGYTAVGMVNDAGLIIDFLEEFTWVKANELKRIKPVNGETLNDVLGKDTKYLKLAMKSLNNAALAYGKNIPDDIKQNLIDLISDRVEMVREDWKEYQQNRGMNVSACGMIGGGVLEDTTANNSYLFVNVAERMVDAWVILGQEATDIFKESGALELVFGVTSEDKDARVRIIETLMRGALYAPLKNIFGQGERLSGELTGLKKLFESNDLEI